MVGFAQKEQNLHLVHLSACRLPVLWFFVLIRLPKTVQLLVLWPFCTALVRCPPKCGNTSNLLSDREGSCDSTGVIERQFLSFFFRTWHRPAPANLCYLHHHTYHVASLCDPPRGFVRISEFFTHQLPCIPPSIELDNLLKSQHDAKSSLAPPLGAGLPSNKLSGDPAVARQTAVFPSFGREAPWPTARVWIFTRTIYTVFLYII